MPTGVASLLLLLYLQYSVGLLLLLRSNRKEKEEGRKEGTANVKKYVREGENNLRLRLRVLRVRLGTRTNIFRMMRDCL